MSKKKFGILTSGGDAPGMNAAIRSFVRQSLSKGHEVFGFERGYDGLIDSKGDWLSNRSVGHIIQRGGTFLKTSRSQRFREKEFRAIANDTLKNLSLDALCVIGGNGSFKGLEVLCSEFNLIGVGIPATIDNDILNVKEALGFDTAWNTAVEMVDKVRDTAESHDRVILIEVMGRDSANLAEAIGISVGAQFVLSHENQFDEAVLSIQNSLASSKKSCLIICLESPQNKLINDFQKLIDLKITTNESRKCILGYVQRGGSPSARDRWLGYHFAKDALSNLLNAKQGSFGVVGLKI